MEFMKGILEYVRESQSCNNEVSSEQKMMKGFNHVANVHLRTTRKASLHCSMFSKLSQRYTSHYIHMLYPKRKRKKLCVML